MIRCLTVALTLMPCLAWAEGLVVTHPMVPLAPKGVMAHAAFFSVENTGATPVSIVGASAEGYAMAHLHRSEEKDGVATMSAVHMVEVAPKQTVVFEHGGLHVMLMRPEAPTQAGDMVPIVLHLSDGETLSFEAEVMHMKHGS